MTKFFNLFISKYNINIPKINEIKISIPVINKPPITEFIPKPIVEYPGCVKAHRSLTSNFEQDKNGILVICNDLSLPSFEPLDYRPQEMIFTQTKKPKEEEKEIPPPLPPPLPKKKEEEEITETPCPDPNSPLRVGGFANQDRLEKVIGFELTENNECLAIWEKVPFVNTFFPSPATAISTGSIALIAASAPLLLNVIKPAVKNIVKKIIQKKKK